MSYHDKSVKELYEEFDTQSEGLTSEEIPERQEKYGKNEIPAKDAISPLAIFLEQFKDLLVLILIGATIINAIIGYIENDPEAVVDVVAISFVVLLNAGLGFYQEFQAEKSLAALKKLSTSEVVVYRDQQKQTIPQVELVPGDVIELEAGNTVPADIRIIQGYEVRVDESILTGETTSIKKRDIVLEEKTPLADRNNMLFKGTTIVNGSGQGLVVATGLDTELGKIASSLTEIKAEDTPLQKRLHKLAQQLTIVVVVLSAFIIIFGQFFMNVSITELFIFSIGLAVAAVPEGLPAVLTLTLALGLNRMAKKQALIRKLPAVEVLGSATVICTDKTGTLTKNEMTVKELWTFDMEYQITGTGYRDNGDIIAREDFEVSEVPGVDVKSALRKSLEISTLANEASIEDQGYGNPYKIFGDPTEVALLILAEKGEGGVNQIKDNWEREFLFPFDSERKMMSAIAKNTSNNNHRIMAKGAVDVLLNHCTSYYEKGKVKELTDEIRQRIESVAIGYSKNFAYRVLGLAYREIDEELSEILILSEDHQKVERDLTFVGLVAMIDPPRDQSAPAIEKAHRAGIRVIMITGDHKETARAIGRSIGLCTSCDTEEPITGVELDEMSDEELQAAVYETDIFARVSPSHKLRIVNALKSQNEVIIMTGDGVNDAPALKRADVGVAMGITGTDVAKEASKMVLVDDNFANIVEAVEEGRVIYDNMKKFIAFLLSANAGEILTVLFSLILGYVLIGVAIIPITAIQLLYINLVTDTFPALALGVDDPEGDVMKRKPRDPDEPIIDQNLTSMILISGVLIALGAMFSFAWALDFNLANFDLVNDPVTAHYAETMAFTTLIFSQFVRAFNASQLRTVFTRETLKNRYLLVALVFGQLLTVGALYLPFMQPLLETTALKLEDWIIIILVSIPVLIVEEIRKKIYFDYVDNKGK